MPDLIVAAWLLGKRELACSAPLGTLRIRAHRSPSVSISPDNRFGFRDSLYSSGVPKAEQTQ